MITPENLRRLAHRMRLRQQASAEVLAYVESAGRARRWPVESVAAHAAWSRAVARQGAAANRLSRAARAHLGVAA